MRQQLLFVTYLQWGLLAYIINKTSIIDAEKKL